jgi:hypothetical protein
MLVLSRVFIHSFHAYYACPFRSPSSPPDQRLPEGKQQLKNNKRKPNKTFSFFLF